MPKYLINIRFLLLVIGFVLLCVSNLFAISITTQLIVFGLIIAFTGIPHGAMDFYLEKQNQVNTSNHFSTLRFYVFYFLNMAAYALSWYFFPSFSLFIFILITAYHFGEIDLHTLPQNKASKIFSTIHGFFTILFIITCHIKETASIIHFIIGHQYQENRIIEIGSNVFIASVGGIIFTWVCLFFFNRSTKKEILIMVSQLSTVLVIIYLLPFYLGFAFYFGLWHSFLSFYIIKEHLSLTNNISGWKEMVLKMLPYSIAALIFIFLVVANIDSFELKKVIGAGFIGISIITLPHLQVFSKTIDQLKN